MIHFILLEVYILIETFVFPLPRFDIPQPIDVDLEFLAALIAAPIGERFFGQ